MSNHDSIESFRNLSAEEKMQEGEDALLAHILDSARETRSKYPDLDAKAIEQFLADPESVRYTTRLSYEFGDMSPHQFAHAGLDQNCCSGDCRILYLRPKLKYFPEYLSHAVLYIIPSINYGDIIRDEHCLSYAATVLGISEDQYYDQICKMADLLGCSVA